MSVNLVKRILSLILTVALLLGNVPAVVFATEDVTETITETEVVAPEGTTAPEETTAPTQPEIATPTEPIIPTEGVPESVPVETSEPTQQETVPEETVASGNRATRGRWSCFTCRNRRHLDRS